MPWVWRTWLTTPAIVCVVEVAVVVAEHALAKHVPSAATTKIATGIVLSVDVVIAATPVARIAPRFAVEISTAVILGLELLRARDALVVGVHSCVECRQLPKDAVQLGVNGHRIGVVCEWGGHRRRDVLGGLRYQINTVGRA